MKNYLNLSKELRFKFKNKPLLIGGRAKEFYKIRKSGFDIDFVISKEDHEKLRKFMESKGLIYLKQAHEPGFKKVPLYSDLYGDHGILYHEYEIWDSICLFDYEYLSKGAIDKKDYLIISLEKLLFLTSLAIKKKKYLTDLKLIVNKIFEKQYK